MKRLKKILLGIVIAFCVALLAMVVFSPYKSHDGFDYKLVKHTIVINAPVDSVFKFLGNSSNARKWSVYVNHISTLNSDEVKDGLPGSIRRAFCTEDEKGQRWDELVTIVEPNKRRQLVTYDYIDFSMTAEDLATEQIYEVIDANSTQLTFTLFFKDHEPTLFEKLKMNFAAYVVLDIYKKNMNNIKRILETGK